MPHLIDEKLAGEVKQAIWDSLRRSPGMGAEAEPIWELYHDEGVAIVIVNALFPFLERLQRAEAVAEAAAELDIYFSPPAVQLLIDALVPYREAKERRAQP